MYTQRYCFLYHCCVQLGKEAVVAAELARIAYPAAEARSRKQELDELRALVASAPQLEKDIDEAEEEVARVRGVLASATCHASIPIPSVPAVTPAPRGAL